jgi:hypothetical protein
MKTLKILILFVILSGCSNKYLESSEEGPIGREWRVLDTDILGQYNVGLVLELNVKDFVEVRDSVKLAKLYESRKRRVGKYKILGGCAIAGCTALGIGWATMSYAYNPYEEFETLVAWLGAVGGVGSLCFISSGLADFFKSDKAEPHYIKKNIICKNSTPLRNDEVKIMLRNTSSEKTYYIDKNGIIKLKFDEIIPEPTEADSALSVIIQYENLVDTLDIRLR